MKKSLLATVVLAGTLTVPAFAQNAPPVQIHSCTTDIMSTAYEQGGLPNGDMVLIAFRNTGSQVADAVTFDILQNGLHYTVTDHGRFAPGATVQHRFADDLDGISSEEPTCTVVNVHYVGG